MKKTVRKKTPYELALPQEVPAKNRSKIFSHLSANILALFFIFVLFQFGLDSLQGVLLDLFFRTQLHHSPHPDIKIISYDDKSQGRYIESSKIPAEELSQLLELLSVQKPRAIVIIGSINEKNYTATELSLISKGLSKNKTVFIGYTDDESLGLLPPQIIAPYTSYLPGFISKDTFSYGADSVSRRVMLSIQNIPTLYRELSLLDIESRKDPSFNHVELVGELNDSSQTYINWQGPPNTYPLISSIDVATKQISPEIFHKRIVIIGRCLSSNPQDDFIFTPYSRSLFQTPLLEGVAHSIVTVMNNNGLLRSPTWVNWMICIFVGLLTVNLVLFLPPLRGILFVFSEIISLLFIGWLSLHFYDFWLNISHPLIVSCLGYYLVIPYRLVDESKKRWHYQEKSELMSQLEQLKSNFLSLVSHDLKTPIARIQGCTELLLNEPANLSQKQIQSLSTIFQTVENLNKYVETVLDLTRIESSRVPISKTIKDINTVVKEVMDSKRLMASEKNIILESDLDTLFSFKFDVRLIRRVLSNLVENAIKYSGEGTTIKLCSRENNNWISVSVFDQGIGIPPEEQDKIFSKFYRIENPQNAEIKGTGLGLYLVKYFIELHNGFVELKSELGKGSVFTVSLPV